MRPEKELLLEEIEGKISGAQAFVITRYQEFGANLATAFRREIRKTGGEFEVVPKRLLLKAAERIGVSLPADELSGHIGVVACGTDAVSTTKAVIQFGKDNGEAIKVALGRFDGVIYGPREVEEISKLPDLGQMRAQLLGLFEAPMAELLSVMEALLSSVIYCLENKSQQGSGIEVS